MAPSSSAITAPVRRVVESARRQPRWFAAACGLCLFYLLFLGGMKAISANAVDRFFEHLPARAAASPAQGTLPYCLNFDHPAEIRAAVAPPGEFALSDFESWGAPGRWTEGPFAGIAVALPDLDKAGDLVLVLNAIGLVPKKRPRLDYQIAVNGTVVDAGTLVRGGNKQVALRTVIPAALTAGRQPLLLEIRTPGAKSLASLGIAPDWRRLGLSISAIHLFRAGGPECPPPKPVPVVRDPDE